MTDTDSTPGPSTASWGSLFVFRVAIPGLLVVSALLCAGAFVALRPKATKADAALIPTRVEVIEAVSADAIARLYATGVVEASRRVTVLPEVSGRITWVSDAAMPGGLLAEGEALARIDSRDYALRVEQAQATVRQAELEVELELGRGEVAKREWALLRSERAPEEAPLALRGPQLNTARQALASAQANLKQAEINLSRTRLTAPFNALVLDESIEVGQVVAPGAPLATLIGTDAFWVTVSLPVDELATVVLPTGAQHGSPAIVRQNLGSGTAVVRRGHVDRLRAQLDPQTRTAQLLVTIDDPLEAPEGELPLLPGAYVDVILEGRELSDVVRLPRTAIHEGRHVWTVDPASGRDLLSKRTVEIGWREMDDVFVTGGLGSGDRVVVSPISLPIDGMPVEVIGSADGGTEEARRD